MVAGFIIESVILLKNNEWRNETMRGNGTQDRSTWLWGKVLGLAVAALAFLWATRETWHFALQPSGIQACVAYGCGGPNI